MGLASQSRYCSIDDVTYDCVTCERGLDLSQIILNRSSLSGVRDRSPLRHLVNPLQAQSTIIRVTWCWVEWCLIEATVLIKFSYRWLLRARYNVMLVQNMKFLSTCQLDLVCTAVSLLVLDSLRRVLADFSLGEGTRVVLVHSVCWGLTFFKDAIVRIQLLHFLMDNSLYQHCFFRQSNNNVAKSPVIIYL